MDKECLDILIEPVRPDETEALLALYVGLFYEREPLTACLGLGRERMVSIARSMYVESGVNPILQGLCWIARDSNAGNRTMGFIVCDDPFAEGHAAIPENLQQDELEKVAAMQALMEAVRSPLKEQGALEAGRFLHIAAVGVAPDCEGAGIATRLLQTALAGGRSKGFAYAFAECTSEASKRCHEKNGFSTLHRVAADTVSGNRNCLFAGTSLDLYLLWKDLTDVS